MAATNDTPLTDAQKDLADQHWRLALWGSKRLHGLPSVNRRLSHPEVTSACMMALVYAARKYDSSFKTTFATYAYRHMRRWVRHDVIKSRLVRVPEHHLTNCVRGKEQRERNPDIAKGARRICVSIPEKWETKSRDGTCYADLYEAVDHLPERLRLVIHGWLAGKRRRHIASEMGVTGKTVNELQARAIRCLRRHLEPDLN